MLRASNKKNNGRPLGAHAARVLRLVGQISCDEISSLH